MRITILAALLAAVLVSPALAEEKGREVAWEGYLWRDAEGRVRLGWPVIAMGVIAMPAHVVEGDLAEKLAPLVSDVENSYFFWNYSIAVPPDEPLPDCPRALVRLRGRVVYEGGDERSMGSASGIRRMTDARLLSVEFVHEDWLRAWSPWFTGQPQSVKVHPGQKEVGYEREFAPKAVAALRAMRKAGGPTDEERAIVAKIDPDARVVGSFRAKEEAVILRWLVQTNEELALGLDDLEKEFGKPPPSAVLVQRWFLACATKEAFLAMAREKWDGDLEGLELPYYLTEGNRTSYTVVSLADLSARWSEEDYARNLAVTKEILDR